MSLCEMTFYSQTLKMDTQITVILPEKEQGIGMQGCGQIEKESCPVLWLLHGRSDDHSFLFFHQFLLTDTFPFSVNIKIHPLQHDNTAKPTLSKKVSCESPKAAFLHG